MAKVTVFVSDVRATKTLGKQTNDPLAANNEDIVSVVLSEKTAENTILTFTFAARTFVVGAHAKSIGCYKTDTNGSCDINATLNACREFFRGKTEEIEVTDFSVVDLLAGSQYEGCTALRIVENGRELVKLTEIGEPDAAREKAKARVFRGLQKGVFEAI